MEKGNYPCAIEEKFVRPCTSLTRALEKNSSSRGRAKGLFLDEIMDLTTGQLTMSFVRMKLGDFLERGVIINVCPFCGINISNHLKDCL